MKKLLFKALVITLALTVAGGLFAQTLENNEYYKKSVELAKQSQAAMDAYDYENAAALAIESQKYAALSRRYIEEALAALGIKPGASTAAATAQTGDLAAEYVVQYNPAKRDCLWRIAGYDFVYGDSTKWYELYDNNKSTFPEPDNPDLIVPGQILKIRSIAGEVRSGRWPLGALVSSSSQSYSGELAAEYEVKLNPARRDCLWIIAGYEYIYGNSTLWQKLYDANRSSFPDPDNPDLILPGQILTVPSINGETRSGRR